MQGQSQKSSSESFEDLEKEQNFDEQQPSEKSQFSIEMINQISFELLSESGQSMGGLSESRSDGKDDENIKESDGKSQVKGESSKSSQVNQSRQGLQDLYNKKKSIISSDRGLGIDEYLNENDYRSMEGTVSSILKGPQDYSDQAIASQNKYEKKSNFSKQFSITDSQGNKMHDNDKLSQKNSPNYVKIHIPQPQNHQNPKQIHNQTHSQQELNQLKQKGKESERKIEKLSQSSNQTGLLGVVVQKSFVKKQPKIQLQQYSEFRKAVKKFQHMSEINLKDFQDQDTIRFQFPNKNKQNKFYILSDEYQQSLAELQRKILEEEQKSTGLKFLVEDGNTFKNLKKIFKNGYQRKIVDADMISIAQNGHKYPNLREIKLWNNKVTDVGLRSLVKNAGKFKNLQIINFTINRITDDGLITLIRNGNNFPSLIVLDFTNNYITGVGMGCLIENCQKFKLLEVIDLSSNQISADGMRNMAENQFRFQSLTNLDLVYNNLQDEGVQILAKNGVKFPKLKQLIFSTNGITKDGMKGFIRNGSGFKSLQILNFNNRGYIERGFASFTKSRQLSHFDRVNSYNHLMMEQGLKQWWENIHFYPHLKRIELWNIKVKLVDPNIQSGDVLKFQWFKSTNLAFKIIQSSKQEFPDQPQPFLGQFRKRYERLNPQQTEYDQWVDHI